MLRERHAGAAVRGVVVTVVAMLVAAAPAAAEPPPSNAPDLTARLPKVIPTHNPNPAPVFIDAHTVPGKLLYRFSSAIYNRGGAMDFYMQPDGPDAGDAMQVIWQGGDPLVQPDPNLRPTGGGFTVENRSAAAGASFVFSPLQGHNHWHFQAAALYELLLPNGSSRVSDKIGFCMWDSWAIDGDGYPKWFPLSYRGVGPNAWCASGKPGATFTRMGISYHYGDYYPAQSADQWVDVTGLLPGKYRLRATVNPEGFVHETTMTNNVLTEWRSIPGTGAIPRSVSAAANQAKIVPLEGKVYAYNTPALRNGEPCLTRTDRACYVWTSINGPLKFRVVRRPAHGQLGFLSRSGLVGRYRYTPTAGFRGRDSFTFTVIDGRGLTSRPATVSITVS